MTAGHLHSCYVLSNSRTASKISMEKLWRLIRVLTENNGKQQPFANQAGVEVGTEGNFDCVQNEKAKKEVVLCSVSSACSSKLKDIISCFFLRA